MKINITINMRDHTIDVSPHDSLFETLRSLGYYGVKFGSEEGESGVDTILLDGKPINAGLLLTLQAVGHQIETIEALGEYPQLGWRKTPGLHPLQKAFIETGAIQCGYCTPAQILVSKSLLERQPNPSQEEIREALSGVLCRCTGYKKPVQAILRAAAIMRGEDVDPIDEQANYLLAPHEWLTKEEDFDFPASDNLDFYPTIDTQTRTYVVPPIQVKPDVRHWKQIGKPRAKVDAIKLAQGKPAFTADFDKRDMLIAKVLRSPYPHAIIKNFDVSAARALPGVAAVLTHHDIPRIVYSTAGQSDPIPGPLDCFSLDYKVRFIGDRVAFVAAETEAIAERAIELIEVDYQRLPPVFDPSDALESKAPIIHDEVDYVNFADSDPNRNLAAKIRIDIGNVETGFDQADHIFEFDYKVPKVQQAHLEPHVVITYWDENDRLVIRTSTQVPFHVRRQLAPVLGLPMNRIRVIKPRIGGGFGGKQEILVEDIAAHLTIATGRPVKYETTREEEFIASRSRHPMKIRMKTGVLNDGTITANEMYILSDTGANGAHALTVNGNTGQKAMALYVGDGHYRSEPNIRFYADVVYTNHPPSGAYRGYGVPQGFWAVERHMEKISRHLGLDPLDFRLKNVLRAGELQPFSTVWSEGRDPHPEVINTCAIEDCVRHGKAVIGWDDKFNNTDWKHIPGKPHLRRGIGVAIVMQGTSIAHLDMGGAYIKFNEDGSFNLSIGATDLGTGSDTVLAQMAAEVLGVSLENIIVYSSDTDFTPFDVGAYASSTTYISGTAVTNAAAQVAERIRERAALMFNADIEHPDVFPKEITLVNSEAVTPDGRRITFFEIGHHAMHREKQEQIMGIGSYVSPVAPPPFAAQFAVITLDIETGWVIVDKLVMAVDSGIIINPVTASGQIEGGLAQALGYALCEEMAYDDEGNPRERNFKDYHIFQAHEMPQIETIFVETFEPSHPFGVKAVAEIPLDGVAPAVGNAIFDAAGVNIDSIPATPEIVWKQLIKHKQQNSS